MLWATTLWAHFHKLVPVQKFLEDDLPKPKTETSGKIQGLVTAASTQLEAAKVAVSKASGENTLSAPFRDYLTAIVSSFPKGTRPIFADTHSKGYFPPVLPDDHYTQPDITSTRPGQSVPEKWNWPLAGTVIELKFTVDVFDDERNNILEANASMGALIQLAKSARSLLASSGSCFVFIVAVVKDRARILRFDHAGFRATNSFKWTTSQNATVFPTFFWRLFNPDQEEGDTQSRMFGEDCTISVPTNTEKKEMYKRWMKTPSSRATPMSLEVATAHSRWVRAVQRQGDKDVGVRCFTIGPPLCESDGLFSRATRVDRVLIESDSNKDPGVYALKDAWRQIFRRPEVDFYDVIHKYCETSGKASAGMAHNHGTLELLGQPGNIHHQTNSTGKGDDLAERRHLRTLLTPVGVPLRTYANSKSLVKGLQTAVDHHLIAYEAGVIHRDISEGNILFDEVTLEAFLVDWDYAEFTPDGLMNFKRWFPKRAADAKEKNYTNNDKSLKERTGTFSFLAIQILGNTEVPHNAGHDLESVYWLLVWIILRHTTFPGRTSTACHELFDHDTKAAIAMKKEWLLTDPPFDPDHLLSGVADALRDFVMKQNPAVPPQAKRFNFRLTTTSEQQVSQPPIEQIRHEDLLTVFKAALATDGWPADDKAEHFIPLDTRKLAVLNPQSAQSQSRKTQSGHLRLTVLDPRLQDKPGVPASTGGKKRKATENPIASTGSVSLVGTSNNDEGSESARKKPKTIVSAMRPRESKKDGAAPSSEEKPKKILRGKGDAPPPSESFQSTGRAKWLTAINNI
ncbi:hypothetical protein DFH07DRAFT_1062436 [Mycena maculata]|uniref:Fungal-type protein kinase domain-containing protein n=1 Tax=Mycena maculata TaxID=230809 RepID=A0AAD7N7B3_9AGAR|nr:hypothetical protein DFH07DRAFT_1062436 [Mycena maculata]